MVAAAAGVWKQTTQKPLNCLLEKEREIYFGLCVLGIFPTCLSEEIGPEQSPQSTQQDTSELRD